MIKCGFSIGEAIADFLELFYLQTLLDLSRPLTNGLN